MSKLELWLPLPPSVNRLWRTGRGRIYKSPKYTAWIQEAGYGLLRQELTQGVIAGRKIKGTFILTVIAHRPDKRRRDLDNILKAALDFCTKMSIIEDDYLCEEFHVKWAKGISPRGCYLTIEAV